MKYVAAFASADGVQVLFLALLEDVNAGEISDGDVESRLEQQLLKSGFTRDAEFMYNFDKLGLEQARKIIQSLNINEDSRFLKMVLRDDFCRANIYKAL